MSDDEEIISKTQLKKQSTALQMLGENLIKLTEGELASIPIPDELQKQIALAKRISHNSGKRRQLQYIGKLMRKIDTAPIEAAYQELQSGRKTLTREFHQLEQWRDRLITEGTPAIEAFIELYPSADRQQLRQSVRLAKKEQEKNKPPQNARKLFRYIRQLHENLESG